MTSKGHIIINTVVKLIFIFCFIYLFPVSLSAQQKLSSTSKKAISAYNEGMQLYGQRNFTQAEQLFLAAITEDQAFTDAHLILAQLYEDWRMPLKAIDEYRKGLGLQPDYFPYGFIRLGNLEYREGYYEQALLSFQKYLSLEPDNTTNKFRANDAIQRCRFAINAIQNPVDFKPINLGSQINTVYDEYWPSLSTDEQTLVITRMVPLGDLMKSFQEDFYISHRSDTGWEKMKNAGWPLNSSNNEGAQTITGDGHLMIFTACNREDGEGRCDLYYSIREGDRWSVPENMGKSINSKFRETQPSITPDGRTLYFSSDRPEGQGDHDIWVSHLQENGSWSEPENLGNNINTKGIEMSPFIHPDNQSLYFASDGHMGMGGYDLFVTHIDSTGKWKKPENLGYPINTNRDEIGLIVNAKGNHAFYSSDMNKDNGKDIYRFDLPKKNQPVKVTYMKGKVFDADNFSLLKADCELIDLTTGKTFYKSFSDSVTGEFIINIPVNSNYMLNVSRQGYLFYSENFSLEKTYRADDPFLKDVPLKPIKIGSSMVLNNVFYETDSFALKKESAIELDKVVKMLRANPDIRIEVCGYTDNTGTSDHNLNLSENRAKTVAGYLIAATIDRSRISYKGYGMNSPIADNNTPEGRALNRRTEIRIIE